MELTLIEKKEEVPGVTSFVFDPGEPFAWKPGQYLHYVLHHEPTDERGSDRWFTLSSAPFEGRATVITRLASEKGSSFKSALAGLAIGETIEATQVGGDFTIDNPDAEYVLLAGGIGITPFHSILKQADHDGVGLNVTLLYATRDGNAPFRTELEGFAERNPKLTVTYLTDPERIDEAAVRKYVSDLSAPFFYLSGPEPMVKALAETLQGMGIDSARIKLDDFPGYTTY